MKNFVSPVYALAEWGSGEENVAQISDLEIIFQNLLNVVMVLAGLVFFVMLLAGGLNYLTSGGDPEKVKKAGGTISNALMGFVLLIASWFILRFISQFSGVDLTIFELPK